MLQFFILQARKKQFLEFWLLDTYNLDESVPSPLRRSHYIGCCN